MSRVPAEQRREQLIEATIDLAIEEGLAAASVRRIADKANVSLGVVHYCFSSKEALLNAVAESFVKPILGPIAKAIEESDRTGIEETSRRAAFDAFWHATREDPGRQLLSYELMAWSIRGDGEAARLLINTYTDVVVGFLANGLNMPDDQLLPLRTLARMILAVCDGVTLGWLVDRDDELARGMLDSFIQLLVALVQPPEADEGIPDAGSSGRPIGGPGLPQGGSNGAGALPDGFLSQQREGTG